MSASKTAHFVIIGAGQAAQSAIEAARAAGFGGMITLIGDEPDRPYQRPPLSKAYLLGDMSRDRLFFRPESYYADHEVSLKLGVRAESVDAGARRVRLSDGDELSYDALLIATGARPKRLPNSIGGALPGVHYLRDLADIDALAQHVRPGARAAVLGGGYIGLEAAAALRKRDIAVTLIEREERLLARVACADTAAFFAELHRSQGVDLRLGAALEAFAAGDDGSVAEAALVGGERLPIDFAVVGVGVSPNSEIAQTGAVEVDDGVKVDAFARTAEAGVYAAGDVARFDWRGVSTRLESVQNAIDQGAVAGRHVAGADQPPYDPTPWFWSDQYDVKLQIAGLGGGAAEWITRPGARAGAQSVWYFGANGALLAVDAMNDARAYMIGKKMLEQGVSPDRAAVADRAADLKSLL